MTSLTMEELMKSFDLPHLMLIIDKLNSCCDSLRQITVTLEGVNRLTWINLLTDAHDYCGTVGFEHARSRAYGISSRLTKVPHELTGITLAVHFEALQDDMKICMFSHEFIQVEEPVRRYLESVPMFGERITEAFPSCSDDIKNAGECIAVDLSTAAVFHLMHIVEWGLRALCVNLKVTKIKNGPIEYATWDDILKKLPDAVDTKINKMARGPKKQKVQEFYHPALKEIRGFKDAWRNHIMHTRATYTREDAIAVFSHVQRFMQGLAEYGIKEIK